MRAAAVVSVILGIARGLMALGFVLVMIVIGIMLVVPRFAPVPVEWEVDAALLGVGTHMSIPVRFYVDTDAHRITAPSLGAERAELRDTYGSLRFPAPQGSFFFINTAFLLALFVCASWGPEQLHRVFGTLRKGQPFIQANARRLRRVAAAVFIGELVRASLVAFNQYYAKAHFTAQGLLFDWSFNIDFFAVVLGLIILAIAEVFAAGTRLDQDQALTI